MTGARTLTDLSASVRSKNAGPFWLTLDIVCGESEAYEKLVQSRLVDPQTIAQTYGVEAESVRIFTMPSLRAVKISFPRLTVQGSVDDRDSHAGQQYIPLLNVRLD